MRVLITGGAGFIGSHLVDHCLARGDTVKVIDDLSTGARKNLAAHAGDSALELVVDSVLSEPVLDELVAASDAVFHLAAAVGVQRVVDDPVGTIELNVHGTEAVLRATARHARPVLIASTSEVYGLSQDVPFREDGHLVFGATSLSRWSYACSKALDEFLALGYARQRGSEVVIARLFNTVGPRQTGRYGMVLPRFVRQALAGEPLTVHGTGLQTRCFGYVLDVVPALTRLLESPTARGEVFNLGSQEEISMLDLARRVLEITGSSSRIVMVPYSQAYGEGFEDMPRRVPDIAKARAEVGFDPATRLSQIIGSVLDYERSRAGTP